MSGLEMGAKIRLAILGVVILAGLLLAGIMTQPSRPIGEGQVRITAFRQSAPWDCSLEVRNPQGQSARLDCFATSIWIYPPNSSKRQRPNTGIVGAAGDLRWGRGYEAEIYLK